MNLSLSKVLISLLIVASFFGCQGKEGPIGPVSLVKITDESPGANCENGGGKVEVGIDINSNGLLDSGEVTSTSYICNGVDGKPSLTSVSTEAPGDNCETGGVKIYSGVDTNGNGILDDSEITSTAYTCNGLDGSISLINITDEAAGANCESGGIKIESGIDLDGDRTLDSEEILVTRYICNRINGVINEEIQIKVVEGIGGAANTSSSTPVVVPSSTTFKITNFANVDSVVFVSDPYVSKTSNYALLELYDITNDVVIESSLIRTNNLSGNKVKIKTDNIFNKLPKEEIILGIKFSSEVDGEFSASGTPYIFLYSSNK